MALKSIVDKLKEKDRDHLLMIEMINYQCLRNPGPTHLVGQFVLTYQLDLEGEDRIGYPITADDLNMHLGAFLKSRGYDSYNRRAVFSQFRNWGIRSSRLADDTKVYFINPFHKLEKI